MYEVLYSLGSNVMRFFHVGEFVQSLPILAEGMLGIFVVMFVIFAVIAVLQRLSK